MRRLALLLALVALLLVGGSYAPATDAATPSPTDPHEFRSASFFNGVQVYLNSDNGIQYRYADFTTDGVYHEAGYLGGLCPQYTSYTVTYFNGLYYVFCRTPDGLLWERHVFPDVAYSVSAWSPWRQWGP